MFMCKEWKTNDCQMKSCIINRKRGEIRVDQEKDGKAEKCDSLIVDR
jgi:hypothetical protein